MTGRASNLAERISAALTADERTQDAVIEVVETHGIVTLKSEVGSVQVREAAEQIARDQEGVLDVVNELTVDEDAAKADSDKVVVPAVNVPGSAGSREGYVA